jgi:hypothetical protein
MKSKSERERRSFFIEYSVWTLGKGMHPGCLDVGTGFGIACLRACKLYSLIGAGRANVGLLAASRAGTDGGGG